MKLNIESYVRFQPIDSLGRAPCLSNQPIDVCSQHRRSMIKREERIKAATF
jgi:hypothetical protein